MKKLTILHSGLARIAVSAIILLLSFHLAIAGNGPIDETTNAKQKVDYVKEKGLLVSQLNPNELSTLPIGIVREIDGKTFIIAVDSARITPQGGFFSAYAAVKLPNTSDDDILAFAAKNVSFKPNGGIGVSSNTNLQLVSDRTITISEKIKLRLPANGHNFIEWDCNGFKTISLEGEFIFDTSMLKPDLEMDPGATKVTATFRVQGQRGFNFLITTSISPFRIKGLGDMSFSVQNATVDLSDLSNPDNFFYPVDYPSYYGGNSNLWRGFYLQELKVKLPKGISTSNGRAQFTAHNVVIDDMGFSGFMGVSNLFDINSGSLDGWAFSIDSVGVQILQNRLVGGSLSGTMNVPFLKNDTLTYAAQMEQRDGELNFNFLIQTNANHVYNMALGGTLQLDAGSQITVQKYNGRYTAGALLQGSLTISQTILNVNEVKFQNLELSTRSPYLIRGTFALTNSNPNAVQPKMAKFPISISNIGFEIAPGTAFLKADVALNLMNSEDKGFSAKTSIKVKVKLDSTSQILPDGEVYKKHKWVYDGIDINHVSLEAKIGSLELSGSIDIFHNDPIYDDGFRGNVSIKFPPLKNPARANVYFGTKDDGVDNYRYWQANLYVPTGHLPIVPPIIDLTGILGGLSYHMTRVNQNSDATFASLTNSNIKPTTDTAGLAQREDAPEFVFVPNKNIGLGILLGVTLVVKSEKIVNADATLGVEFNVHGGINQVFFKGGAYFFSGMDRTRKNFNTADQASTNNPAPVVAFIDMLYDNPNNVFHASIKTYINIAGVMKGTNANNLVGEAVVHVDPRDWYMYIGRPSQMMGLSLIDIVDIRSYFMMGTKIEKMPPPPPQVSDILGGNWTAPDYTGPMASGNGFGFGAHFAAHFPRSGEFTMGPFYAGFQVGAGADIMITRYNGQVNCGGNVFVPGIKGWYAAGQVYAYLQGSIGIKIKHKKFSIIDIGAAAILQARLPNPTFMKGAVGGRFRILGGLIKGSVRFSFTIGKDCAPVSGGSELDNIKIIESMKPDSASTYVSVFVKPTAVFNTPINAEMPLVEDDGNVHTYRIFHVSTTLTRVDNGQSAFGNVQFNSTNDAVVFNTTSNLAGETMWRFKVTLKWQEKIGSNWLNPGNGAEELEVREVLFRTGNEPMSVPPENVDYSYPVSRQYNVYKQQTNQGYVQLKTGQPAVFATNDQFGQWNVVARFGAPDGSALESPVTYNNYTMRASFDIPTGLDNNKIYTLGIVKVPVGTVANMPLQDSQMVAQENVYVAESTSVLSEMNQGFAMDNQAEQDQLNAANTTAYDPVDTNEMSFRAARLLTVTNELVIYRINFRTSIFNTLNEKLNALSGSQDVLNVLAGNITAIGKRYTTTENFDEMELFGKGNNNVPLIQMTSTAANDWYTQKMNPLMYEMYGFDPNVDIEWRNLADLRDLSVNDIAPMRGVKLHNNLYPNGYTLTDEQVNAGFAPPKDDDIMFAYYLSYYCSRDFNELRNKAAVLYLAEGIVVIPQAAERLIYETGYTDLLPGQYDIKVNYMLPGYGSGVFSSTKDFDLHFRQ